jgi:predicted transporter
LPSQSVRSIFPLEPSIAVVVLVAVGVSLFIAGDRAGIWAFRTWLQSRSNLPAPPARTLNLAVVATSPLGLAGIALIALDRLVLSGIDNSGYAELLLIKAIAVLVLFGIYTNAMWSGRRNFCIQMTGLIQEELRVKLGVPEAEWVRVLSCRLVSGSCKKNPHDRP